MGTWFYSLNPVLQALIATTGTWLLTASGAVVLLFVGGANRKILDGALGMAAGVMIAASYWSLLAPAIEMSEDYGSLRFLPAVVGFLAGAGFLRLIDRILPHLHTAAVDHPNQAEGIKTSWRRTTLLILAITIHNFPEGLAVGVAFGATAGLDVSEVAGQVGAAIALAIGIGLQNFPEGAAVALPLKREGVSTFKALWYAQLSAIVEPVAGVLGAALVVSITAILPYTLAFAAGAMIFVVVEELIPASHSEGNVDTATLGTIVGFALMMTLDVALG
ncbi:MAG TPA: ZIP family metal transporter [Acidobacteriota bacterium]|nr:ZIP family metal transporter [Acidobacteriota bacterium]